MKGGSPIPGTVPAPSMKYFMVRHLTSPGNYGPVQLPRGKTALLILVLAAVTAALWIHFEFLGDLVEGEHRYA